MLGDDFDGPQGSGGNVLARQISHVQMRDSGLGAGQLAGRGAADAQASESLMIRQHDLNRSFQQEGLLGNSQGRPTALGAGNLERPSLSEVRGEATGSANPFARTLGDTKPGHFSSLLQPHQASDHQNYLNEQSPANLEGNAMRIIRVAKPAKCSSQIENINLRA